jgi:circadian clock protein KaiB
VSAPRPNEPPGPAGQAVDPADQTDTPAPAPSGGLIDLWLYVAGQTAACVRAVDNLYRLCGEHLSGQYRVELIDLTENPAQARVDEIIAVPTLVRKYPPPLRRVIGDLSNTDRVLAELRLRSEDRTSS